MKTKKRKPVRYRCDKWKGCGWAAEHGCSHKLQHARKCECGNECWQIPAARCRRVP
jgi:hypothetical protein